MEQEDYYKIKDIEYRNSSASALNGQDAIDLANILSKEYLKENPEKPSGKCPFCHSEEYCEHWFGLGWKNPNYVSI